MPDWREDFDEYRDDGWPLCPMCHGDELYSPYLPKPPLFEQQLDNYVAAGLACYFCNWKYPAANSVHMQPCGVCRKRMYDHTAEDLDKCSERA